MIIFGWETATTDVWDFVSFASLVWRVWKQSRASSEITVSCLARFAVSELRRFELMFGVLEKLCKLILISGSFQMQIQVNSLCEFKRGGKTALF